MGSGGAGGRPDAPGLLGVQTIYPASRYPSDVATAIDLFCGAGGLTHGLEASGVVVKAGIDMDSNCRFPYEANNKATFHLQDVSTLSGSVLANFWDAGPRILVGCAPCQTFSTYSMGKKSASTNDKRWSLISDFSRLVRETTPDIVSMENVPRAKESNAFALFLSELTQQHYHVWFSVVNCVDFGVPQSRRRLVLLASRLAPLCLEPPIPACQTTVRDTISHLDPVAPGVAHPTDPLHYASDLTSLNKERVAASTPGGTWKDWPTRLQLECHKRTSGQTYRNVYGRMKYDEPAPTLTTHCLGVGNGRFIHPEQNRGLTIREVSLLQTFPEDYKFVEPGARPKPRVLSRLIGNAVPVLLAKYIGEAITRHLDCYETR